MKVFLCTFPDCMKTRVARGWCEAHYRRWRRYGTPQGGRLRRTGCAVEGCRSAHSAKGYCVVHYARWARHGDPQMILRADVDVIAVERAVVGDAPGRLTQAEREAAVRRLHRMGFGDRQIAEHIGVGTSGAWTIRTRLGLPANGPKVGDFSGRVR